MRKRHFVTITTAKNAKITKRKELEIKLISVSAVSGGQWEVLALRGQNPPIHQGFDRGKLLFQLEDGREKIAVFFYAIQNVGGLECQEFGILLFQSDAHFIPCHRGGNRGPLFGAQRVNGDGGFMAVILTPINKHFSAAQTF